MVTLKQKLCSLLAVISLSAFLPPNAASAQNQRDGLGPQIAWAIAEGNEVNQVVDFTKHLGFGDRHITTVGLAFGVKFEQADGRYLFEVVKDGNPPVLIISFTSQAKGVAWRVTSGGEIMAVVTARDDGHGNVQYFDIPKDKWGGTEKLLTRELDFWDKNLPDKYRTPKRNL